MVQVHKKGFLEEKLIIQLTTLSSNHEWKGGEEQMFTLIGTHRLQESLFDTGLFYVCVCVSFGWFELLF